jgi:hypothetical protein
MGKDPRGSFTFTRKGVIYEPMFMLELDGGYVLVVYQGGLSEHDLLVKYKQPRKDGKWSRLRTPKHIHWAADILIKQYANPALTKEMLAFFKKLWIETQRIQTVDDKKAVLNAGHLLHKHAAELRKFESLNGAGEYRVDFLLALAMLLMVQEKTNMANAFMFGNLLDALEKGEDLFAIISTATHNGR